MGNNLITFGEIMTRFSPSNNSRISQSMPGNLDIRFAGCEASVAVSYSKLGGSSFFVTALPKNDLSHSCIKDLKSHSVNTNHIVFSHEGRLGAYYVEKGSNQRPSKVTYDRSGSAISLLKPDSYPWDTILKNKTWLHISGITPALSKRCYDATTLVAKKAKDLGIKVSCDLNFRSKLWRWDKKYNPKELARIKMPKILKYVDTLIANEQDAEDVLEIEILNTDFDKGALNVNVYPKIAKKITNKFPNLSLIAITLRESISANHNRWGAMLFDCNEHTNYFSPLINGEYVPFEIENIVDRLGAGDSFAAGLIFSLNHLKTDNKTALDFAVAASCLAHSIEGDYNISTIDEVNELVNGFTSGRVQR